MSALGHLRCARLMADMSWHQVARSPSEALIDCHFGSMEVQCFHICYMDHSNDMPCSLTVAQTHLTRVVR